MKRCMEVIRHRRDWIRADSPNRVALYGAKMSEETVGAKAVPLAVSKLS
jgi:hypothetical protein